MSILFIIKNKILRVCDKLKKEVRVPVYIPLLEGNMLENRTVLITGGAGGIGFAIAKQCVLNGASVIITGRNIDKLINATDILTRLSRRENVKIKYMQLDLYQVSEFKNAIKDAEKLVSGFRIDTLINNAGISCGSAIGGTTEKDFDSTIDTNLKGTYFFSQEFSNYLINNNIEGNILNVSSVSGVRPVISPYMLSKWGINGLTEGLAKKLIKHNIVVNGIAPGPTATEMIGKDGSDLSYIKAPAKRFSDPAEIGNIAVFLISKCGRMIVGDTIYITGGCGNLTLDDITY